MTEMVSMVATGESGSRVLGYVLPSDCRFGIVAPISFRGCLVFSNPRWSCYIAL